MTGKGRRWGRAAVLLLAALVCRAQEPAAAGAPSEPADPGKVWSSGIAVRVNRDIITRAEVWRELRGQVEGLPTEKRNLLFEQKVREMILARVELQATERLSLQINPSAVQGFIEEQKEELGGEEAFKDFLTETGRTEEDYITDVTSQNLRSVYIQTQAGARAGLGPELRPEHVIEPTFAEVREHYRRNLAKEFTTPERARVMTMALTLFDHGGGGRGPEAKAKTLEKARELRQALVTGADFQTLARREDRQAAENGGDLGWIDRTSEYAQEVIDYAFSGPIGVVSEPIESRSGVSFFLVLIVERQEAGVMPFETAQKAIREKLRAERRQRSMLLVRRKLLENSYIWPARYKAELLRMLDSR